MRKFIAVIEHPDLQGLIGTRTDVHVEGFSDNLDKLVAYMKALGLPEEIGISFFERIR